MNDTTYKACCRRCTYTRRVPLKLHLSYVGVTNSLKLTAAILFLSNRKFNLNFTETTDFCKSGKRKVGHFKLTYLLTVLGRYLRLVYCDSKRIHSIILYSTVPSENSKNMFRILFLQRSTRCEEGTIL